MTLNGIIALILRFFSRNSIALHADYVTVVEDRPLQNSVVHCWPKLAHPAARSLSAIAEIFVSLCTASKRICYVLLCYLSIARNEILYPIYCIFLCFHTKGLHIYAYPCESKICTIVVSIQHSGSVFTAAILAKHLITYKYFFHIHNKQYLLYTTFVGRFSCNSS